MNNNKKLHVILVEPFFTGSHKQWAESYQQYSQHNIDIISLKGRYWKWRMHGGALTLAKLFNDYVLNKGLPDLILTTDMLNLPVFTSFANVQNIPIISFFHENQLTYPWSTKDRDKEKKRDHHYGFINYTTALRSQSVMFNSYFHKNSFLSALKKFLNQFPDYKNLSNIDIIKNNSIVSYLGLDLKKFDQYAIQQNNDIPIILWNHRWEYDKNPEDFFNCLNHIKSANIDFQLVILGEQFDTEMEIFTKARDIFKDEIIHLGYCNSFEDYAHWLWKSDIIPVTTNQEFFGASIMEAVYCNVYPLLPVRLTYPELFDNIKHENNFYYDYNELNEKLKQALLDYRNLKSFKQYAKKYDWTNIAPKYDIILSNTFNKNYLV